MAQVLGKRLGRASPSDQQLATVGNTRKDRVHRRLNGHRQGLRALVFEISAINELLLYPL